MLAATAGSGFAIESLREYAGIVVDAKSGEVLYEHEADAERYPASLTKVMTLYILFQELEAGNVELSDRMKVSPHAAAAVPTKLGLKPGWTITVSDAMKSLVTLSANDMARVIAEHISGSEAQFAERMTATARALGMSHTTYKNASGLPDAEQMTTARDQTTLGIAIQRHFPQYYDLFQTESFSYGGRTYDNHNRLLGSDGVDGIKTGYTRSSGSNLLTSARQDHRHIVVAAIGFASATARDAKVRELVEDNFSNARKGSYLEAAAIPLPGRRGTMQVAAVQPVTPQPYPDFRAKAAAQVASLSDQIARAMRDARSTEGVTPALAAATMLGGNSDMQADGADTQSSQVIGAWVGNTYSLSATEATPASPKLQVATGAPATVAGGDWLVQIGAAPSRSDADLLLEQAAGRVSQLLDLQAYVERFERHGRTLYRARFAGFDAMADAADICKRLRATRLSCLALPG